MCLQRQLECYLRQTTTYSSLWGKPSCHTFLLCPSQHQKGRGQNTERNGKSGHYSESPTATEWVSRMVANVKKNSDLRICIDLLHFLVHICSRNVVTGTARLTKNLACWHNFRPQTGDTGGWGSLLACVRAVKYFKIGSTRHWKVLRMCCWWYTCLRQGPITMTRAKHKANHWKTMIHT